MGNHNSSQSQSGTPNGNVKTSSNKINTLTPVPNCTSGKSVSTVSPKNASTSGEIEGSKGSSGGTRRRVSNFFNSRPSQGALLAMAAGGTQIMLASQNLKPTNLEKFAKHLMEVSSGLDGISKSTFQTQVFLHSHLMADNLWDYFSNYSGHEALSEIQFLQGTEKIYAQITDKEQIGFYVKLFAKGRITIGRQSFRNILFISFELNFWAQLISSSATLHHVTQRTRSGLETLTDDLEKNEWIEAVIASAFHLKDEMSVAFVCNWIEAHLPRLLLSVDKYVKHQLTTGYTQAQAAHTHLAFDTLPVTLSNVNITITEEAGTQDLTDQQHHLPKRVSVTGISPVLLWLFSISAPSLYSSPLERKPEPMNLSMFKATSPQQLIRQLLNQSEEKEPWTELYNSSEHGISINRFQYNLFNYKGPTLLFVRAENGYSLCIGSDEEWKESSKFWGGEDAILFQLQPEFRIVERGCKILYTNFTIRGYPLGIQVSKDPKQILVEIKPDFQYVSFKGMPCRILQMTAYGCGSKEVKTYQTEYKKWESKQCELQRVVKRNKADWNENPDKYLLEMGGVAKSYAHGNM